MSSSGDGNGVRGRGIVRRRGGRGGRASLGGRGGGLEAPLPLRPGLYFHHEITLPMGDPGVGDNHEGPLMARENPVFRKTIKHKRTHKP
jgi:hypothetical protein